MSACLPSTHGTGDDHGFDGGLVVSVGAVPEEIIILLSPFSKLDTSIFDTFYYCRLPFWPLVGTNTSISST